MMLPHKVEIEAQHPAIPYSHSKTSVLFCPRQHHGFVYKFSPLAVTLSQVGWVIVGREEREFVIETSVFVFSSLPWQYTSIGHTHPWSFTLVCFSGGWLQSILSGFPVENETHNTELWQLTKRDDLTVVVSINLHVARRKSGGFPQGMDWFPMGLDW